MVLDLKHNLVPDLGMSDLRDAGGGVEADVGKRAVVDKTVVAVVPKDKKAGNHEWEPVGSAGHMKSSLVMELVVAGEKRSFFDIADLSAGLAFLPASPQTGMVAAQALGEVEVEVGNLRLVESEDRRVMTVV